MATLLMILWNNYLSKQNKDVKTRLHVPFTRAFSVLQSIFKELTLFVVSKVSSLKTAMQYDKCIYKQYVATRL